MDSLVDIIATHPFLACLALLSAYHLLTSLITWHRLSHIPGPLLASITNFYMIRTSSSTRLSTIFETLSTTYGKPLVRIGPNQLLTTSAALLRRTGAVRDTYARDDWYIAFRFLPWVDNVFNLRAVAAHDARKAQIAVSYNISGREVDLIEPSIDEQVHAMVALLKRKYADGKTLCEFAALSSYVTLDVITRAAFGRAFGHLHADADVTGYLTQLRSIWPMVSVVNEWPLLRRLFYSTWYIALFGPKVTDETGLGKVRSVVAKVVDERFTSKTKIAGRKDMLDSWMQHGLSQPECEAEGLLALAAGSETTATVMRMTLLCLLASPPVYQKLKIEVKRAVRSGGISDPVSFGQAKALPYLTAVVMEGMRMRPGTVGAFSKVVPPHGETVGGFFIPGGTLIAANIPGLLRDTEVFGPDAAIFRPERWLEADDAQMAEMVGTVELMFGSGRWMCAGRPIAYMELYKIFFELFRHFDFHLANPTKPWDSKCYNVFIEQNMWVRVTEDRETDGKQA